MKRNSELEHYFERPMLNWPVREGTSDAQLLISKVKARLEASRVANEMLAGWYHDGAPRMDAAQ